MARRRSPVPATPTTTFADLVAAHDRLGGGGQEAERQYKTSLATFTRAYGEIDDVFWGADGASGAAVTVRRRPYRTARLHRVSDKATRNAPEIAGAIQDWGVLAVRAQALRGASAQVCMRWVFGAVSYLLGTVLAAPDGKLGEATTKELLDRQKPALKNATAFYVTNAIRGAHLDYFWGMLFGALVNAGFAFGIIFFVHWGAPAFWDIHVTDHDQAYAIGAVTAGATGTILSVLLRMTVGRFGIAYEVGRTRLFVIGSFRPFIGAVFGAAVFFALRADFIDVKNKDTFPVIVFLAFLAGFSERFARDTFLGIGGAVTPASSSPTATGTGAFAPETEDAGDPQTG